MDWHRRFLQQATWTGDLRSYLFEKAGMSRARRVLEVGCGTGAILEGLATPAVIHALDLHQARLAEMRLHAPAAAPVCGDALALPYPPGVFDITFCHFLLLWVSDPLKALEEMKSRLTELRTRTDSTPDPLGGLVGVVDRLDSLLRRRQQFLLTGGAL